MYDGVKVSGSHYIGDASVFRGGMDEQCTSVVAQEGTRDGVVLVFSDYEAASEGWEKGEGGGEGVFEVLDYCLVILWCVQYWVVIEKALLVYTKWEELEIPWCQIYYFWWWWCCCGVITMCVMVWCLDCAPGDDSDGTHMSLWLIKIIFGSFGLSLCCSLGLVGEGMHTPWGMISRTFLVPIYRFKKRCLES